MGTTENGSASFSEPVSLYENGSEEISEDLTWVRKSEAASRHGVSERTIENRVKAGTLRKRLRDDGTVEILVAKEPRDLQVDKSYDFLERMELVVAQRVAPVQAELAAEREKRLEQAERIGELRKEAEMLREQLRATKARANRPRWRFW
jgi:Flp pilus assembly CpaF family ATPase